MIEKCLVFTSVLFFAVVEIEGNSPRFVREPDILNNINDISSMKIKHKMEMEEDLGVLDSFLGDGTQARIIDSVNNWISDKAKSNPGCVERFVCETYRTGESMTGLPYLLMSLTNAAVSFMVAEMFDQSIDIQEITRAARYGRTIGTCHNMKCDFLDSQLRTLGDYLGTFEDFLNSVMSSISNSINLG
eukprot:TRINITY_DN721_c0_g1_i1.p1 TRINITY_DN721_c0_g1~~TRINITY_DN721_c0_g1_i1.p1  ORF type:complete len:188 (-),score=42.49 TRINITY_DN721_c0_g1_i1:202-765(-)